MIHVYHHSKSAAKQIKELIKEQISEEYLVELPLNTWAVGGTQEDPADTAQKQLEEKYPGSTVAVTDIFNDDFSMKCRYMVNPSDRMIYLCSSEFDHGFKPCYNDNIYYINLVYESDPKKMVKVHGTMTRDVLEKERRIAECFNTGDDDRFNCSNYVINPIFTDVVRQVSGNVTEIGHGYSVREILFDAFNGYTRSAQVIRDMLFGQY